MHPSRIEIFHASGDFLVPGGFDRFVVRFIQTLNQRASKFRAFRHRQSESLLQEVVCFVTHYWNYTSKELRYRRNVDLHLSAWTFVR